MFPTGLANMLIGQPIWFSYGSDLCNRKYEGRGPENCENTKFVTHFCWVEILINLVFLDPYIILVVVGQRPTSTRPTTIYGIMQNQWVLVQFRLLMTGGVSPETCWASIQKLFVNTPLFVLVTRLGYMFRSQHGPSSGLWLCYYTGPTFVDVTFWDLKRFYRVILINTL